MDEQLKQIGERLRGLREVLDLTAEEVAATIDIDVEKYKKIEEGESDITISKLMKIAHTYGVSAEELMFAEAPRMKSYFVVRKGQGLSVERTKAYKYKSLGERFRQSQGRRFHCHRRAQAQCAHRLQEHTCGPGVQSGTRRYDGDVSRRQNHHLGRGRLYLFRLYQAPWYVGQRQ